MKVFIAGIVLAVAGTGVAQVVMSPHPEQAQAAPVPTETPEPQQTFQHITSLPFDAATYNMNESDYPSVDGPDPAKLWDDSADGTARSADGWDGTSPSIPTGVTTSKTGSKGTTSKGTASTSKSKTSTTKSGTKSGTAPKAKTQSVAAPKVPQGTRGALATPATLSQGASVKPVKVPLY